MDKIKKFDEFINESVYDENDGFTSSVSEETPITKTPLPEEEVKKLREKFNVISDCVTAIINKDEKEIKEILGENRAMIVCSMPGAGLTHSIEDSVLKANGTEEDLFTIHDGIKINESILYSCLQKYNNKLIVIEDFERILDDYHCRIMLKHAMSDGIINSHIPGKEEFTFNGYIILASRMRIEELMKKYNRLLKSFTDMCSVFNIFPDEEFKNTYIEREKNY